MSSVMESVESSFKQLVAQKPYRSITVKEICEGAFVSRRTFYANFVDKRAVIAYLFRRDAVHPVKRAFEILSQDEAAELAPIVTARFYQGILDDREYYGNLVKPMAGTDATFELVTARAVCKALIDLTKKFNPQVDEQELGLVAYYHASAIAISTEKWIYDGFEQTPETLGLMLTKLVLPNFEMLVKGRHLL